MKFMRILGTASFITILIFLLAHFVLGADLYVEQGSGTCSNAYTRTQAMVTSTPWCAIEQLDGKALAGDNVHVIGPYRDENTITLNTQSYSSPVILNVSRADISGAFSAPTWNSEGSNIYNAIISSSSNFVHCYYNNMLLYPYNTRANMVDNSGNPRGSFWDNANNNLTIRLWNGDAAPNSTNIFCAQAYTLEVVDIDNLTIAGDGTGNISWGTRVVAVYSSSPKNFTITGVNIKGGASDNGALSMVGLDYCVAKFNNITSVPSTNLSWCMRKDCSQEAFGVEISAIWSENNEYCSIENNTIEGYFNGIAHISNTPNGDNYNNYRWNNLNRMGDDSLEFEKYAQNVNVSGNFINNAFVCLSIAPLNCTSSLGTCIIEDNICFANQSVLNNRDTGSKYSPYGFKLDELDGIYANGLTIRHNSILNSTKGWYDTQETGLMTNNQVTYNIFDSDGTPIEFTGKANNGNYFNYNAYNRRKTGTIFEGWNNNTGTSSSLSVALSSIYWDGTWDTGSVETGFDTGVSLGFNYSTYEPDSNTSVLCLGNGEYIGARIGPCEPSQTNFTELPVINEFLSNDYSITNGSSATLSWDIDYANNAYIDNGIGSVSASSGNQPVSPQGNTTYTLTANNSIGNVTANLTIVVTPAAPPSNSSSSVTLYTRNGLQRFTTSSVLIFTR